MSTFQTADLIYLLLLLLMVAGWFLASNRESRSKLVQQAMIWGFIFVGVIAMIGLWDDIRHTVRPMQSVNGDSGQIILPRQADGHYHLVAQVNGTTIEFVVDTGASQIVLTRADAQKIGIDPAELAFTGRAQTANGMVRTAPVRLDTLSVGGITDENLRAVVNESDLFQSLLGMSYLQHFSKVEIQGSQLILTR